MVDAGFIRDTFFLPVDGRLPVAEVYRSAMEYLRAFEPQRTVEVIKPLPNTYRKPM